mmetsp:Transcript_3247/g.11334  ORF Transcript_3247/g.11334 Transcript_3247/m.11334 type:complete len:387 (-) Transcript_3247:616-1776(-)
MGPSGQHHRLCARSADVGHRLDRPQRCDTAPPQHWSRRHGGRQLREGGVLGKLRATGEGGQDGGAGAAHGGSGEYSPAGYCLPAGSEHCVRRTAAHYGPAAVAAHVPYGLHPPRAPPRDPPACPALAGSDAPAEEWPFSADLPRGIHSPAHQRRAGGRQRRLCHPWHPRRGRGLLRTGGTAPGGGRRRPPRAVRRPRHGRAAAGDAPPRGAAPRPRRNAGELLRLNEEQQCPPGQVPFAARAREPRRRAAGAALLLQRHRRHRRGDAARAGRRLHPRGPPLPPHALLLFSAGGLRRGRGVVLPGQRRSRRPAAGGQARLLRPRASTAHCAAARKRQVSARGAGRHLPHAGEPLQPPLRTAAQGSGGQGACAVQDQGGPARPPGCRR